MGQNRDVPRFVTVSLIAYFFSHLPYLAWEFWWMDPVRPLRVDTQPGCTCRECRGSSLRAEIIFKNVNYIAFIPWTSRNNRSAFSRPCLGRPAILEWIGNVKISGRYLRPFAFWDPYILFSFHLLRSPIESSFVCIILLFICGAAPPVIRCLFIQFFCKFNGHPFIANSLVPHIYNTLTE